MKQGPTDILFTPFNLRGRMLRNRIVMAPLTRDRAVPITDVPQPMNATYYAQRAEAGLIIAEATQISPTGKGYAWTPGIYSPEQIRGWKLVTEAVHQKGGTIYLQLWHVGRISHSSLQPGGILPVAPSAIAPHQKRTFIEDGSFAEIGTPRALELGEIPQIINDYRQAARNAMAAGFDGVEIHAANGYLIHQFLAENTNLRTDRYGGSVQNRLRFAFEVMEAVVAEIGAERTAIRISPVNPTNDIFDSAPQEIFFPLVKECNRLALAYVHVIEGATQGPREFHGFDFQALRNEFKGPWMVNNGYSVDMAVEAISSHYADLVAFGRFFIANPDLVNRIRLHAPLNEIDWNHVYGGGAQGYTDYPMLETGSLTSSLNKLD